MDPKVLKRLVEQAKSDPKFFHALVFDTENVLSSLEYLDRNAKASLIAHSPEEVIGRLVGDVAGCDVTCTSSCGATCGESCGYTTNLQAALRGRIGLRFQAPEFAAGCDVTCTSSCGATCGDSCGYTTNLQADLRGRVLR